MNKQLRQQVYQKFGGRCAYCGNPIDKRLMQVDHIVPVYRGQRGHKERIKQSETIDDLNPACGRCNRYKATMSLDVFRREISKQVDRARAKSLNFRLAEDYGLIKPTGVEVVFYFERSK